MKSILDSKSLFMCFFIQWLSNAINNFFFLDNACDQSVLLKYLIKILHCLLQHTFESVILFTGDERLSGKNERVEENKCYHFLKRRIGREKESEELSRGVRSETTDCHVRDSPRWHSLIRANSMSSASDLWVSTCLSNSVLFRKYLTSR